VGKKRPAANREDNEGHSANSRQPFQGPSNAAGSDFHTAFADFDTATTEYQSPGINYHAATSEYSAAGKP
jgi:hypothetical protein